jgi:DNA polymerase-3 subunit epsilon
MRQIFLDTETTGLYPAQGHRIIEIAAVEVVNRRVTKRFYHQYINPEREIDPAAQEVHGLSIDFLQDKPKFADITGELVDFIADAELIMHNAPFDVGFLNHEFGLLSLPKVAEVVSKVTDTLKMAKELRPGQRNNLDALCRHYGVDNAKRTLHGALLDSELLAEVYMAMTRGQESLIMDLADFDEDNDRALNETLKPLMVKYASANELEAHEAYLDDLGKSGSSIWKQFS